MKRLIPALLIALVVAACGGGDSEEPPSDTPTSSTFGQFIERADVPTVVYDGTVCTFTGPETVAPGPVKITLDNRAATRARIDVLRLPDDKTYADVVAYVESGEAQANQDSPEWVTQTRIIRAPANELITANRAMFDNDFAILCYVGDNEPFTVSAVAGFTVSEG